MTDRLPPVEYRVEFNDGPTSEWQLLSFELSEQLNGSSELTVELASETLPELSELLGAGLELELHRSQMPSHAAFGVVLGVDLLGHAEHRGIVRVHAVSAFDLAGQRQHTRIWQDVSVLDIVAEVLDAAFADYGRSHRCEVSTRGIAPRSYCVQYRESDRDFVCRLLEEEGINYYFDHDRDAGHEVLVLCETNDQYLAAENVDGGPSFPLISKSPDLAELESLQSLEWDQRVTSTTALRRDYDWRHPAELLTSEKGAEGDERGLVRRVYVHGHQRFERDEVERRAGDLVEALARAGSVARAESNAVALRPGLQFSTDAHDADGAPQDYVVIGVRHHGGPASAGSLADDQVIYANEIECVPLTRAIRPLPRTPKPRTRGPQTATVVGDGEIHVDKHGRIQVQFHWEEQPSYAADASCWVRVAQSWAGPSWGTQFIPRVGMEVVVEFLDGNPDRPLVTGCVYNGDHEPPFALPDNATQSGWRTDSSPGGGGSNELRFEDAAGAEEIYVHGQKDWRVEINNDTSISTVHDETISVGNDRSKSVGNDQRERVGNDKSIVVANNHDETIGAAMTLAVGTDQDLTIGANQTITVVANNTETIGANMTQTIGASATQIVGANNTVKVGGLMAVTVEGVLNTAVGGLMMENVDGLKAVKVGGMSTEVVTGDQSLSAANISSAAKSDISMSAGEQLLAEAKKHVAVSSEDTIGAAAKTRFVVEAGDEFTVKCGDSSLTLKKNGAVMIKGKKVSIKGSDEIKLVGGKIHNN
ncbi:Phage-related baseplate assembly protein [Enhygromyxa salina]|uniref:Phage-related baseplate assembly protein n=1 Tax=Enhygromyxa salina TaxID=215803 RepID=A0A2S9XUQ4_9BACT|nr:type VI secretion system tip protein TssI/VgrG [Enhygromyxa salina]PRP96564.1 Phage-related baseplate assembly protein [Enhygromyxa salina]